jgi:alkylation response protein AidB-like acyl-CoA dehydrogenase
VFDLTPAQQQLQGTARELAQEFATRAARHDAERSAPLENFARLREAGFHGLVVPQDFGGLGGGMFEWTLAAEELAQGCAATTMAFNMHISASGMLMRPQLIALEPARRQRLAQEILDGALLCASATEPGSSSRDLANILPVMPAVPDGQGGYRLSGRKAFVSNFEACQYALLYARPTDAVAADDCVALLVPTRGAGVQVVDVWDTLGMRATRSNEVIFEDVPVPAAQVIERRPGLFFDALTRGGLYFAHGFSATYLGVGVGLLDWARQWLNGRVNKLVSQPMSYHPDARRRIGELATLLESARLQVRAVSWLGDHRPWSDELTHRMWLAKAAMSQALARACESLPMICGASALFSKHPFGRMLRDATTANIMPPSYDALLDLIGSNELGLEPAQIAPPLRPREP